MSAPWSSWRASASRIANGRSSRTSTLSIGAGERVALIGPNGAGKSTLLSVATGLLRPVTGRVRLTGEPVEGLDRLEVARRLAVVPGEASLPFATRVEEVVALGRLPHEDPFRGARPADRAAIAAAIERVGVGQLLGRDARELSLGERQLVLIALSVAQAAPVLVLDEPTVHLDLRHQVGAMELLVDLNERDGTTIIAVLHDLALAAHFFPRLVLLDWRPDRCGRATGGRPQPRSHPRRVRRRPRLRAAAGRDRLTLRHAAHPTANARTGRLRRPTPRGPLRAAGSIPDRWPPSDVGTPTMTMGRAMAGMVRHHGSMRIADFALERYFARWEFAAKHLLCASDVQALPDGGAARAGGRRDQGAVGRARARLHRIDRASAAATRDRRAVRDHRRRRGPDLRRGRGSGLLPDERAVRAGRPRHRDLARLPEPVRGGASRRRRRHAARAPARPQGWAIDLDLLRSQVTPATSLIVVNLPHNPTGMLPDRATFDALVAIAAEAGAHLLVDEVYRGLELDPADRLPTGADAAPARDLARRHVQGVRAGGAADRLAGEP